MVVDIYVCLYMLFGARIYIAQLLPHNLPTGRNTSTHVFLKS